MPGFTPNLSIPYPVAADNISAYPALSKQQAEALEALLYDSGWIDVPLASGITSQGGIPFRVRRIGSVVYPRSGINGTGIPASTTTTIATLPAGFRPAVALTAAVGTSTSVLASVRIETTGIMKLITPSSTSSYYLITIPWTIN